jgi:GT2 family glycosyltransferase
MTLKLSVIVVNWNVRDLLEDCLHSLYAQMLMPREFWEVIVVDNDSADGSTEMVRERFPTAILLHNHENVGFGKANNQAFRICHGEYILLLNPDTVVLDHAVDRLLEMMEANPELGVLGCRLINADGSFQRWTGGSLPNLPNITCHFLFAYKLLPASILPPSLYLENDPKHDLEVGWVSGACMLLRREALGGTIFDERFFLYGEDLDLCDRLARDNWKVVYTPRVQIIHYDGRSLTRQSAEVQLSKLRNLRYVFAIRNPPTHLFFYDLVVTTGFLIRSIAFGLGTVVRPARGLEKRAANSRQFLADAFRALIRR